MFKGVSALELAGEKREKFRILTSREVKRSDIHCDDDAEVDDTTAHLDDDQLSRLCEYEERTDSLSR